MHCDLLVGVKRPLSLSGRLEFGKERLLLNHMSILGEAMTQLNLWRRTEWLINCQTPSTSPVGFEQYIGDLNIKRFGGMVLFVFCFVWEKGSLYQTDRVPWNCFKATFSKTVETTLSSDRGLLCAAASWLPTLSYLSEGLVSQWDTLWWLLCYANF